MSRAAYVSLGILSLLLLIAVIRQLDFVYGTMVKFEGGTVILGGEADPVLNTLRDSQSADNNQIRSLLVDSQSWQPKQRLFFARHETTNLQYRFFLNAIQMQREAMKQFADSSIKPDHNFQPGTFRDIKYNNNRQPIVNVSWQDANAFCRFANMRLPTSEEYEAAFRFEMDLRAADEYDFPVSTGGNDLMVPMETAKYRTKQGVLQEIIGNVMEWTAPVQGQYFLMGYSYKNYQKEQSVFHPFKRHYAEREQSETDFGFRCVYAAPRQFQEQLLRTQTITRDGMKCWRTRDNIGPDKFNLLNDYNKPYYAGGMLLPDELCELPQKIYQLGPDANQSTVELIRQNPWGYSNYLLGKPNTEKKLDTYWLDAKEVSVKDYRQFLNRPRLNDKIHAHPEQPKDHDSTPLKWNSQLTAKEGYEPVTGISWWDAFAYCTWQNKRLPFADEWENAAKDDDGRLYAWGNDYNQITHDITPRGLHNMTRSVSEWTGTFIVGSNSAIVKGGSELFDWRIFGRSYVELKVSRTTKSPAIGFRCAK